MTRMGSFTAASALLALTGCAEMAVVHEPASTQAYYDGALEYAASKGELRTVVVGNPFGGDKASFDAAVTRMMTGANFGPPVTFTTRPSPRTRQAYKVAMAFNAPRNLAASDLCADGRTPIATSPSSRGVGVMAAFCEFDRPLSEADGYVLVAKGPDDPSFRRLVRAVTTSLFPVYDHHDIGGDDDRMP